MCAVSFEVLSGELVEVRVLDKSSVSDPVFELIKRARESPIVFETQQFDSLVLEFHFETSNTLVTKFNELLEVDILEVDNGLVKLRLRGCCEARHGIWNVKPKSLKEVMAENFMFRNEREDRTAGVETGIKLENDQKSRGRIPTMKEARLKSLREEVAKYAEENDRLQRVLESVSS